MKAPRNNEERLLEEVRRLTQANGDLRKERDRAVAEAKRQDCVAKGLREENRARDRRQKLIGAAEELERLARQDYNDDPAAIKYFRQRAAQLRQEAEVK